MVLFGQVSTNMRMMMQMMAAQAPDQEKFKQEMEAVSHN